jgi:tRNA nucleotidyltransferase (CCA-adding enzyme)
VLAVGGFVRDKILGKPSKDLDLEVFGLSPNQIVEILIARGHKTDEVGKSFGVIKVGDLDISVPRRERKHGVGHKGFDVECDPSMSVEQAAQRRDFTINAISMDLETGEIIDPVNGTRDLHNGILRHVSQAFAEDPLRVLRGVQFAGRFGFDIARDTATLCRSIKDSFHELAAERVWGEFEKLFIKGVDFPKALEVLGHTGWIEHFPEIAVLFDTPQEPAWHPEGNVGLHTGFVMNEAAKIATRDGLNDFDRLILVAAALFHDIGKPDCTAVEEQDGVSRIVSPAHDKVGRGITEKFLERLLVSEKIIEPVANLVAEHMTHCGFKKGEKPSKRTVRRLANRLQPVTIEQWARIVEADASGRPPLPHSAPVQHWVEFAKEIAVDDGGPKPILMGRHLIKDFKLKPGPHFGKLLDEAFEAQLDGEFETEEEGLRWLEELIFSRGGLVF